MCGQLPLALAIRGPRGDPSAMPLSTIATELHDSAGCLDAFRSGDSAPTSGRLLLLVPRPGAGPARLFRLLSLHPGPTRLWPPPRSLGGFSVSHTRHLLDELIQAHLVEERTPGRFALHDLLGAYARSCSKPPSHRTNATPPTSDC